MQSPPPFSFPWVAKVIAIIALLLAVLALLGVAATANLLTWAVVLVCIAIVVA